MAFRYNSKDFPRSPSRMFRRMNDPRSMATCIAVVTLIPLMSYGATKNAPESPEDNGEGPRVSIVPRRSEPKAPSSDIRVDVNVVFIPVTVTDALGHPILGLSSDAFHISEDGI